MISFNNKQTQINTEKSDHADFSDYAATKKINGFQHFGDNVLLKLKKDLNLRLSLKSLRNLRKYFNSSNVPTVLALKVVDSYWSSGNGYLDRTISQTELATNNPHVIKALKLYEKLRKEFGSDSPRTLKDLLSSSVKSVISDSRDVIRYSYGKSSLECECYEKGRRTRYFADIVSRWDIDAESALRRAAVIGVVSGGIPVAVVREEFGNCPLREAKNFGIYAESLDLSAFDYGGDISVTSEAPFTKATVLFTRDNYDSNSAEIFRGDRILLITYKNTERDGLKEFSDFLKDCNSEKLISRIYACDDGILNELITSGKGFEISVPDNFSAKGKIVDFVTGRHLERTVVVVRRQNVSKILSLVDKYDYASCVIGKITARDFIRINVANTEVVKLHLPVLRHRSHDLCIFRIDEKPHSIAAVTTVTDDIEAVKRKLTEGNFKAESGLNGVNSAKSVLPPYIGKYQSTPAQIVAITPSPDRYEDIFNASAVGTQYHGYDLFSDTVNTVLTAVMKLVVSGVSIYNIALNTNLLFTGETTRDGRGLLLERALACLYVENSLSLANLSTGAEMTRLRNDTPLFSVTATGSAPISLLISPNFKKGDKLFRLGIPRDEYGIPDFKYVLKLAAAININIGTGNITAGRLIEDSVLGSVVKGTAGSGSGFSFASFETDGVRNATGDLLLAVQDIEELAAFDCEYVGVADDTGILKSADIFLSQSEISRYLSRYPFADDASDRVSQALVAVKATVKRRSALDRPTMTILHCDFSSEFAIQSLATAADFNVNSMFFGKDTVASTAMQRKVRERIASTDMLIICGRSSYGGNSADNILYDILHRPAVLDAVNELIFRNDGLVLSTGEGSRALMKLGYLAYGNAEHSLIGTPGLTEPEKQGIMSRLARLRISNNLSPMLTSTSVGSYYYVAQGGRDMRFYASQELLGQMAFGGQIAAQYADCHGFPTRAYPYNPDGSSDAVAALTSPAGRVLGFFCLPEKTAFLKFEPSLMREIIISSADYFRNGESI